MSKKEKKTSGNFFTRLIKRVFYGPGRELSILEEEQMQTPIKAIFKSFLGNKIEMVGFVEFTT